MKPSVENCMQWVERDKKVIAPCSHLSYFPLVVAEAKQDMVYDEDGNGYIDFLSSASSLNLGSGQPAVHAAVMDQMGKGTQYTIAYSYNRAARCVCSACFERRSLNGARGKDRKHKIFHDKR